MPYKDRDKQKLAQKESYERNKERVIDKTTIRRRQRALWFYEYKKNLRCKLCPENHPACLDFHHRDKDEKRVEVCWLVAFAYTEERILEEVGKCDVLCSNCHRKYHWDERWSQGELRILK